MRNPNGYGGIVKMKGNRRNPYRVRVTVGYEMDDDGHTRQVQRTIGSFETYEEAAAALAAYHKNPVSLDPTITLAEIYRRWSAEKYPTVSTATVNSYTAAYNAIPMLHDITFKDLRRNHLQNAIDTCGKNLPTLQNIRIVLGYLFTYAIQNDIVDKDYSKYIDLSRYRRKEDDDKDPIHTNFKPEEIKVLWDKADAEPYVKDLLMLIYSGLRISEFLALTPDDIDLDARFLTVRKSKTLSGRRRVPIAKKTLAFWKELKPTREEAPDKSEELQYKLFARKSQAALERIGLPDHLPHDTRHTTATLLHSAKVDPYIVKRILGHSVQDITEKVYTHFSDKDLLKAIDKI